MTVELVPVPVPGMVSFSLLSAASDYVPDATYVSVPSDLYQKKTTTQEAENNHQSVDNNTLPNHTIAAPQCSSLLVMEATQSAPSNLPTMKMRPDATGLIPSQALAKIP
ncbi:hypothetical protein DSO57_1028847 [Entomophthora muscae]|uniref:Uncharacterized protein n=1 Tax=Entomophthora muscae TaxID=34485 RepID=A0ACC2SQQ9_9FUNG|nr:hypothetical protein DSO57_1028847 [Entomophthora muscae]